MPPTIRVVRSAYEVRKLFSRNMTISGTVVDGETDTPLSRTILCYRNGETTALHATTISNAATGAFSLIVNGNHNDEFKVEAVGFADENTVVFDHVREPA